MKTSRNLLALAAPLGSPQGMSLPAFPAALPLILDRDGAQHFESAASALLGPLSELFAVHAPGAAGTRLFDSPRLRDLLAPGSPIATLAERLLGSAARPVRAILFDKSAMANWGLGWHQDRTNAVRSRADCEGFGPWSAKRGVHHVAPPWPILSAMRTLRVHLDPVSSANAPLLIAPGSHLLGVVSEPEIDGVVARLGTYICLASAGDVWAYATPILHASAPSESRAGRRVLQLDYAGTDLPPPLDWYGLEGPDPASPITNEEGRPRRDRPDRITFE